MFNPIRFVCLCGAALALSACSAPQFEVAEVLGLQPKQQAVAPAPAARVEPVRVAASAPVAQQQVAPQEPIEEEVEEVVTTSRWGHQRIGNTPNLDDGDETGGWGG